MNNGTDLSEAEMILRKLEGMEMPYVPNTERRAAVMRAIRFFNISAKDSVEQLLQIINTDEEQLNVHSSPSDPED